jgi:hypothetical protein
MRKQSSAEGCDSRKSNNGSVTAVVLSGRDTSAGYLRSASDLGAQAPRAS